MPDPTLNGIASIKGMNGATAAFDNAVITVIPISADTTSTFEEEELKDGGGQVVTLGATNPTEEMNVELILTDDDVATARTFGHPEPNDVLSLASMPVTAHEGDWNIKSAQLRFSEAYAKLTLRVKRYGAPGSADALGAATLV